jgi:high frequency lysogenization protein
VIKKMYSITLSLAGICQSVHLVQQLAHSGTCDQDAFKASLKSILEINPTSVIKIYGNHEKHLNLGLTTLVSLLTLSNFSYSHIELMKYIFDMMIIEKKLKNNYMATCSLKKKY